MTTQIWQFMHQSREINFDPIVPCHNKYFFLQVHFQANDVSLVSRRLRRCFDELAAFTLVFFSNLDRALVQLMYLIYNSHSLGCSCRFVKAMESAFLIMLGKSNASDFIQTYSILGPIIYSTYNEVILCFAFRIDHNGRV